MKKHIFSLVTTLVFVLISCNFISPDSLPTEEPAAQTPPPATPAQPTRTPVTPTVTPGRGELVIQRYVQIPASNGEAFTTAQGTIPFKILFNQATGTFDVKGTAKGDGRTEYRGTSCTVMTSFLLDYTLEGTLIPTSESGRDGCYLVIQLLEGWQEVIETAGQCHGQSAVVPVEMGYSLPFGPYKLPLIEGATTTGGEGQPWEVAMFEYTVKLQKLDIPLESGCMEGVIVK